MITTRLSLVPYSRAPALVVALFAFIAALPASAGTASANRQAPQITVRYADLDLDSDAGAQALYRRIAAAARRVCPNEYPGDLGRAQAVRACRDQALTRAIDAVGSPRLAAIQAAQVVRTRAG